MEPMVVRAYIATQHGYTATQPQSHSHSHNYYIFFLIATTTPFQTRPKQMCTGMGVRDVPLRHSQAV